MAAVCNGWNDGQDYGSSDHDRIKLLYPAVNESETPLPRAWSPKHKYNYIGLSQNNLRVHYKGHGKTHKDAASVRATYPIPASCGLYYFEVKIISKGRDGYMGIGLSTQGVNMNRLPGWDKHSYGYHGDDGHSFCSSGTGQPYGPTFTTGDVIGCGVNLIENNCFYTINGHNLGIAFTDLPPNLYPTVGLQTPGEVIDANFGQHPFIFNIEDLMRELNAKTRQSIQDFEVPGNPGEWQAKMHEMVSSYLVHHGFCATVEALHANGEQTFSEEISSIKNRQKILKLVLSGRMGEAIELTSRLYPGLLESSPNLLFTLKCRQFVEMVNGADSEIFTTSNDVSCHDTKIKNCNHESVPNGLLNGSTTESNGHSEENVPIANENGTAHNSTTNAENGYVNGTITENGFSPPETNNIKIENGFDEAMDVDPQTNQNHTCNNNLSGKKQQLCGGSKSGVEKMLQFGRELYGMSQLLRQEHGKCEKNKKMLQDAFSLLAYSNPWNSPVGWQLDPTQRETVCAALNSAILESSNLPRYPDLEVAAWYAQELIKIMSKSGLGVCAFANADDFVKR